MYLGGNRRSVPLERDLGPFHDALPSSYVIHEVTVSCHIFRNTTSYNKMTEPDFKTIYNSLNFSFEDRQISPHNNLSESISRENLHQQFVNLQAWREVQSQLRKKAKPHQLLRKHCTLMMTI